MSEDNTTSEVSLGRGTTVSYDSSGRIIASANDVYGTATTTITDSYGSTITSTPYAYTAPLRYFDATSVIATYTPVMSEEWVRELVREELVKMLPEIIKEEMLRNLKVGEIPADAKRKLNIANDERGTA